MARGLKMATLGTKSLLALVEPGSSPWLTLFFLYTPSMLCLYMVDNVTS